MSISWLLQYINIVLFVRKLRNKKLVPVHKWGKGKEESSTSNGYILNAYMSVRQVRDAGGPWHGGS